MLLDGAIHEIVERDDGYIESVTQNYFAPPRRWAPIERRALRWARGRVLDVGVGAGRVALELQRRGREVVAIDVSPGAVEVARRRGVRDVRLLAFEDVDESLGHFDTIVMYGNNFGLFGVACESAAAAAAAAPARGPDRGHLERPLPDRGSRAPRVSRAEPRARANAR